jgi:hypothetical protein
MRASFFQYKCPSSSIWEVSYGSSEWLCPEPWKSRPSGLRFDSRKKGLQPLRGRMYESWKHSKNYGITICCRPLPVVRASVHNAACGRERNLRVPHPSAVFARVGLLVFSTIPPTSKKVTAYSIRCNRWWGSSVTLLADGPVSGTAGASS